MFKLMGLALNDNRGFGSGFDLKGVGVKNFYSILLQSRVKVPSESYLSWHFLLRPTLIGVLGVVLFVSVHDDLRLHRICQLPSNFCE